MILNRRKDLLNHDPEVMIPVDRNVATARETAIRTVIAVTETLDAVAMTHETSTKGAKAFEAQKTYTSDEDDLHDIYDDYNDYDNYDGWNADESRYTDEEREENDDPADEDDFVAAANEVERRNETDGMYAISDARFPKTEQSRGFNRDNRSSGKITLIVSHDGRMVPVGHVAICRTRLTFVEDNASSANKSTNLVFQELTKLVRTKVDKKDIAPELQTLLFGSPSTLTGLVQNGLPQLAEPVIEAECAYAFVRECEWPVKSQVNCMISTENGLEGINTLGGEDIRRSTEDSLGMKTEGIVSSVAQEAPRRRLNKEVRLLPGGRMGWWSAQKFDRRVRMRTLVEGAVNAQRTRILLDTGPNVSIVSARNAQKLGLRDIPNQDCSMDIQGISKENATTTRRTTVKITLGWERVYVFEWVGVLLGTDFMIPAGVRLNMFHSNAKLPDDVHKQWRMNQKYTGPITTLNIPRRERMTFKVSKRHPSPKTHDVWIRRTESVVPTVTGYRKRCPYCLRLTNITDHTVYCPAHLPVLAWVPLGHLPRDLGYVRVDSMKYAGWQVLAYAEARHKDLYKKEEKLYEQWLATQPSTVARPEYTYPTSILRHEENETAGDNNLYEDRDDVQRNTMEEIRTPDEDSPCSEDSSDDSIELNFPEATPKPNFGSDFMILENSFISVVKAITTKGYESSEDEVVYVHEPADFELTDYSQELVFLPDLSDHSPTELDFSAADVLNPTLSVDDQAKLVNVLKTHRNIMIASGNALPLPAYGVVSDTNVHVPINQRARRLPIRYLQKSTSC
ncbi:hypothetical protein PHMEG_00010471 [Phytophthora megakarya]|uniref:Peptidase A2 domain-containing protein n=1 Tax=Phytophthora megakarya TaxID=4795 RepID=A0A225WEM0_9STRA|nr:hypothetical protein PHMEG_00010471 [Phytophthora megakarya]